MGNYAHFNYSYWELKEYFSKFDLIVIGSGIVGLSTAISFRNKNPRSTVLVLEKGLMPDGASTKNAGFACFGSIGEIIADLKTAPENVVWDTVYMRWQGLNLLRERLGDRNIGYEEHGGFELFYNKPEFEKCADELSNLNSKIKKHLGVGQCYSVIPRKKNAFLNSVGMIRNKYEGQIDTAKMMSSLMLLAHHKKIKILNNVLVTGISDMGTSVAINTNAGEFTASTAVVATNGYASQLLKLENVKPARAQVIVTNRISDLKIRGTFHFDEGYYYFRNIDNRILFGGGRNLDFQKETTFKKELNNRIHKQLDHYLKERILPGIKHTIEARWSGIMGVGAEKKPVIENYSTNIVAAVRMGGMGIAIGSLVGQLASDKLNQ
jgi:gamma-glutamylputrescine oxidase